MVGLWATVPRLYPAKTAATAEIPPDNKCSPIRYNARDSKPQFVEAKHAIDHWKHSARHTGINHAHFESDVRWHVASMASNVCKNSESSAFFLQYLVNLFFKVILYKRYRVTRVW